MILRRVTNLEHIEKAEKGDLVTNCHSILGEVEELFLPATELHKVNEVRQTEIHTAERLVPELSAFELELTIEKLKSHKTPGIEQVTERVV